VPRQSRARGGHADNRGKGSTSPASAASANRAWPRTPRDGGSRPITWQPRASSRAANRRRGKRALHFSRDSSRRFSPPLARAFRLSGEADSADASYWPGFAVLAHHPSCIGSDQSQGSMGVDARWRPCDFGMSFVSRGWMRIEYCFLSGLQLDDVLTSDYPR